MTPTVPCNRCSMCGLNYPTNIGRYGVCGGDLDRLAGENPPSDWADDVKRAVSERAVGETPEALVFRHRVRSFERLGFDEAAAVALAGSDGDYHRVAGWLAAGCTLGLASRIVL